MTSTQHEQIEARYGEPTLNRLFHLIFDEKTVREFWGPATFLMLLFLGAGVVCFYFKDDIVNQQEYVVKRENIHVVAPPSWINGDFVTETLQLLPAEYRAQSQNVPSNDDGGLTLNANDPRLVENLRVAVLKHPLVESVKKIAVLYPATVKLEIKFRAPVALVDPTSEFQEQFHDDLKTFFPKDFQRVEKLKESPASVANEVDETDDARPRRARYLVDQKGKPLPTRYFVDHPDVYANLPRVAGIAATSASASADPILEEAGAFARFLEETKATPDWQITALGVVREYGATHGEWFFKTSGNAFVKWGRFTRKAGAGAAPSYAPNSPTRDAQSDWSELYRFQYRKFKELRKRILENAALVETLSLSDDPEIRDNAEKKRLKVYDVADFLRDEEENDAPPLREEAASTRKKSPK